MFEEMTCVLARENDRVASGTFRQEHSSTGSAVGFFQVVAATVPEDVPPTVEPVLLCFWPFRTAIYSGYWASNPNLRERKLTFIETGDRTGRTLFPIRGRKVDSMCEWSPRGFLSELGGRMQHSLDWQLMWSEWGVLRTRDTRMIFTERQIGQRPVRVNRVSVRLDSWKSLKPALT